MTVIQTYVMLRRYLALEKGEQVLLRWRDIMPTKYTLLHKICIYRYLNSKDNIVNYSAEGPVEALRELSLPPSLYSCLIQWKRELRIKRGVQATESDMPIFPASEFFSESPSTFLTYKQLRKVEDYIEEKIDLHGQQHIVRLRDSINTKDIDLNKYKGDYFRNDFEIQALLFGLDPGAIDSILGRKSSYTYARHYVDYRDEFIQEMIALTIERMIAMASSANLLPSYSTSALPDTDMLFPKGNRISKQYIISVEDNSTINVSVSNAYGIRVSASVMEKED